MRVFFFIAIIAFFSPLHAELPSPSGSPSLEQRIADLEAYVNNSSRGADVVNPATGSNIGGPGPSYNAWMMTCAALLLFVGAWMFAVYFPIAHMVWGIDGWMNGVWNPAAKITAIDFAGGTVVHMTSGWSALVLCIFLGHRLGFRREIMAPHSMVLCMVGTGLLWVGWYGFNAGSALAPDGIAAGIVPFFACTKLKTWLGYDDALDTFGIHAVGGTLGAFLTGFLATATVNPNLSLSLAGSLNPATQNGLARIVGHTLWIEQSKAIVVTITVAVVGSAIIGAIVRGVIGLRIAPEIERQGLDINQHGEEGYITS